VAPVGLADGAAPFTNPPALCLHRASGRAVVRLDGVDHYCGKFGTPAAEARYHRLLAEWVAADRSAALVAGERLETIAELVSAYTAHVRTHYRKRGRPTGEVHAQMTALRYVVRLYADLDVAEFGPLKLKAVRQAMVADDLVRRSINHHVSRLRAMFRWAGENELIDPLAADRLACVRGLRRGQGGRETTRRPPVAWSAVEAVRPHVAPQVWAMVRLGWHTGMRPGEVRILRTGDLDRRGPIWLYRPREFKIEHTGEDIERVVALGPEAQAVLAPWLRFDPDAYCFQPAEAEAARNTARRQARRLPSWPSHAPKRRRARRRSTPPGACYTTDTYRKAIVRACVAAFPPPAELGPRDGEARPAWLSRLTDDERSRLSAWHRLHRWTPQQLRKAFANRARQHCGTDAARAALGHADERTTREYYLERDVAAAVEVARRIG